MKTALLLSVIFILTVACGQSTTAEPTDEPPRTEIVTQPVPTPTVEESPPTEPPTVDQTTNKQESILRPERIPPTKSKPDQSDDQVAVSIYLIGDGQEDTVVAFIESNGGDPRNVSAGYIEAYIPMSLMEKLSAHPEVGRVQKIIPPEPN